jgi:hypothetical protein
MKKNLRYPALALFILAAEMFIPISSAYADLATTWNVQGNWNFYYYVEDGEYNLVTTINSENLATGVFSGTGNVSGTVNGSSFNLSQWFPFYDSFGAYVGIAEVTFEGTIASDGTIGGNAQADWGNGTTWTGGFWTDYGDATSATPIPTGILLLGPGLAGAVALRRRYLG